MPTRVRIADVTPMNTERETPAWLVESVKMWAETFALYNWRFFVDYVTTIRHGDGEEANTDGMNSFDVNYDQTTIRIETNALFTDYGMEVVLHEVLPKKRRKAPTFRYGDIRRFKRSLKSCTKTACGVE